MIRFIKIIIGLVILCAIVYGAMNVYFRWIFPVADKVRAAAAMEVKEEHIHTLTYAQIPITFRKAIISTEDRRFANDPGIDLIGIGRSLVVDIQKDGYVEGGSTITQQLVDNTLLSKKKTLHRKILQMFYAIGLYMTMPKHEIFTLYTNVIYFGQGAYGLYNASETYFGRTPKACNDSEITMLAGLPNAPTAYDPFHALALAKERQSIVVENMEDAGAIDKKTGKKILSEPLRLRKH